MFTILTIHDHSDAFIEHKYDFNVQGKTQQSVQKHHFICVNRVAIINVSQI